MSVRANNVMGLDRLYFQAKTAVFGYQNGSTALYIDRER